MNKKSSRIKTIPPAGVPALGMCLNSMTACPLYTSDAADGLPGVIPGGAR